jgi:hypothetical protein
MLSYFQNRNVNYRMPEVIGIGAEKCGTTSLHQYLRAHPEVGTQRIKETRFFAESGNWHKGVEWYVRQFPQRAKTLIESHGGDYTSYPKETGVPQRIYSVIPSARFIYLVRDPIDRMVSRYIHNYSEHVENRSINEALLDQEDAAYIPQSSYFMQLEQYFPFFDESRFLIISHKDFLINRRETLRKIFQFLNVDADFWSNKFDIIRHPSYQKLRKNRIGVALQRTFGDRIVKKLYGTPRYFFKKILYSPFSTKIKRPVISLSVKGQLRDIFKKDVKRLEDFAGRRFEGWLE